MNNHITTLTHLDGKRGVIVGAASGIGKAIAEAVTDYTKDVLLVDLDPAIIDIAEGMGCRGLVVDIGREEAPEALVPALSGTPHFLINCAGVQNRNSLLDFPESEWQRLAETNFDGTRRITLSVARSMVANGIRGSIVNITSSSVHTITHGIIPYSITKAALQQFTRGLAAELGPVGIRVNAIAPGYVRTAMTREILDDPAFLERLAPRIPLGHLAEPEDMVGTVLFLLSPGASYITGVVIPVDGGFTLGALLTD